jgi:membrane fusion protein (multidrug efflux system)
MKKYGLAILLVVLIFGLVSGCKGRRSKSEVKAEAIYVEAVYPEYRTMAETVEVSGNLESVEKAEIYAKQSGIVKEVYVQPGDQVKKDTLLAKIEDDEIALSYRQAKNSYELLKDKYEKYKDLFKENMVSEQEFKEMERSYRDAESNYLLYKLKYENTELRSPIDGTVVEKSCEPHQFLSAMEKAFTVARLDQFRIKIYVTESALEKLKLGQEVAVRIDAIDGDTAGYPHRGNISMIGAQVDANTGTAPAEVLIKNPPAGAKPGMFARLKIITSQRANVLAVPKKALVREEPAELWVIRGDRVELRQVHTGLEDESYLEVIQGISPGEQVVTAGQEALSDKSQVKVVNSGAKPGQSGVPEAMPLGSDTAKASPPKQD